MYTEHFGLTEKPFSISPDPRYLYLSQRHADALAHLIYGISESGGFIQLTGEVGTGKTTLIRSLLEQLPERTEIALVLNPPLTTQEFLLSICQELRIEAAGDTSLKALIDRLNSYLLSAHAEDRRVVLIVDEAQTLNAALLEQIRLLTNLETAKRKLLQIILIGQPELRELLARPDMRQIAQRITGRYHLEPLSARDARIYIRHRMRVAGAHSDVFTDGAMRELYRLAGGIPRLINVLADRALLAAYTRDERRIGVRLVRQAASEVFGRSLAGRRWAWFGAAATTLGAIAIFVGVSLGLIGERPADGPATNARVELSALALDAEAAGSDDYAAADIRLDALTDGAETQPPLDPIDAIFNLPAVPVVDARPEASALFKLWGHVYTPRSQGSPCEHAPTVGLHCLTLPKPSLADLRQIDRPVVLELTDNHGNGRFAVLTRLGHDFAELTVDDTHFRVSIADLSLAWFGEHWLLWQPATAVQPDLQPGMRSERVAWLREALVVHRNEPGPSAAVTDPLLFDVTLADRLRDYQRARHLAVDGVLGALTQVVLQADVGHRSGPTIRDDG